MAIALTKLGAHGRVSIPKQIRQKLELTPGAVVEWSEEDGRFFIRRASRYSSEDIHRALFGDEAPARRSDEELKQGLRDHVRARHARR